MDLSLASREADNPLTGGKVGQGINHLRVVSQSRIHFEIIRLTTRKDFLTLTPSPWKQIDSWTGRGILYSQRNKDCQSINPVSKKEMTASRQERIL